MLRIPQNAILRLCLGINHEINDFFSILIHILRHSTNTKILKASTSLEKKKRLFKKHFLSLLRKSVTYPTEETINN